MNLLYNGSLQKTRRKTELANLDRFSQPLPNETYFEDEKSACQCTHCDEDLYNGEWHFKTDDGWFCDRDCFVDYILEEVDGRSEILEVEE